MSPLSKDARSPRLTSDQAEPNFTRTGRLRPAPEDRVLSAVRPSAAPARLVDETPRAAAGLARSPFLGTAPEVRRPFELRADEPAAMSSALTGGPAAPVARPRGGGILRKTALAALTGLALVGAAAIAHSLGVGL